YSPARSPGASSPSRSISSPVASFGGPAGTVGVKLSFTIGPESPTLGRFLEGIRARATVRRDAPLGIRARAGTRLDRALAGFRTAGRSAPVHREPLCGLEDRLLG